MVYPGYGDWVGSEGYYTGYYPGTIPDPIFNIFKARDPTHGRMKAILKVS